MIEAKYFLQPANTRHRQYEALRAYFVEDLSSAEAALRHHPLPRQVVIVYETQFQKQGLVFV